jgi:hypothetical protein
MADPNTSNDEKQLIELKLVSLLHAIALRMFIKSDLSKQILLLLLKVVYQIQIKMNLFSNYLPYMPLKIINNH